MTCSLSKRGHFYNDSGICSCGVNCGEAITAAFKRAHDETPRMTDSTFWLVRDPQYPKDLPHIVSGRTREEALVSSAKEWSYGEEETADYLREAVAVPLTENQVETLKLKHGVES